MLFGVKANVGSNPTVTAKWGFYEFPQLVITNSPGQQLPGGIFLIRRSLPWLLDFRNDFTSV
jgi:hypothetical protein